jgi:NAD(P)-dependent dehydrogenase (short-subunit alcohol dehydrogenase family)
MIEQKVAIVTGAARGIGYSIALQLARDGCAIAIFDILEPEKVEENTKELKKECQPVLYFQGDLAQSKDHDNFCKQVMKEYGRIDFLINNAGVAPKKRMDILETTEDSFNYVLDINLKGTFFLTQKVANIMIDEIKKYNEIKPKIINIASISSYTSSSNRGEYCISKAGVSMITKLFADRLSEYNINVYEIRPGIIYTDMTKTVKDKYDKLIANGITPIKRWGYPEDVAKAVSVCCLGKLDFSTGEIINVDGGFHLKRF